LARLRPYIIEHAVSFEIKFFKQQVENGTLSLTNTYKWLKESWDSYQTLEHSPNPTFDLYPDAMMKIITKAPKFNDEDIVPETLNMDIPRLVAHFNSWQDITILGTILIVFKQAAGPKIQTHDLEEAKTSLWVLLNDSESTMAHVAVQMAHQAGKIRGRAMTALETTNLQTMTEKTLAPGSKLYELIQSRIGSQLQKSLLTTPQAIDTAALEKWGVAAIQDDMVQLTEKLKTLGHFNRAVYGALYAKILEDIKVGIKSPLRDLFE
jgi:hypothetical protein